MATSHPTLPTIWHIPDDLWMEIRPLLGPEKAPRTRGRPIIPYRKVMDGILYVLRTGCQWKHAPREYGSGSTLHRRFQQWVRMGLFRLLWRLLIGEYDYWCGIRWEWQSIDSSTTKAPLGGEATGKSPTDRGKLGTKRHIVTDERGAPLSLVVTGANRHDMKAALPTIDARIAGRPWPTQRRPQQMCADRGYDFPEIRLGLERRAYRSHIRRRGEEEEIIPKYRNYKPRRWVTERTHSWINRYRRLLVRWEKKKENYIAMLHFAFALTIYRLLFLG
jgi:putative transposase